MLQIVPHSSDTCFPHAEQVLEWLFGMHCDHSLHLPWFIVYNYSFMVYDPIWYMQDRRTYQRLII